MELGKLIKQLFYYYHSAVQGYLQSNKIDDFCYELKKMIIENNIKIPGFDYIEFSNENNLANSISILISYILEEEYRIDSLMINLTSSMVEKPIEEDIDIKTINPIGQVEKHEKLLSSYLILKEEDAQFFYDNQDEIYEFLQKYDANDEILLKQTKRIKKMWEALEHKEATKAKIVGSLAGKNQYRYFNEPANLTHIETQNKKASSKDIFKLP